MVKKEQLKTGLKIIPSQECDAKEKGHWMELLDKNENGDWKLKMHDGYIGGVISDNDLEYWDIFRD